MIFDFVTHRAAPDLRIGLRLHYQSEHITTTLPRRRRIQSPRPLISSHHPRFQPNPRWERKNKVEEGPRSLGTWTSFPGIFHSFPCHLSAASTFRSQVHLPTLRRTNVLVQVTRPASTVATTPCLLACSTTSRQAACFTDPVATISIRSHTRAQESGLLGKEQSSEGAPGQPPSSGSDHRLSTAAPA